MKTKISKWDSDPIRNHLHVIWNKYNDISIDENNLSRKIRSQLRIYYEEASPVIAWHTKRLGPPIVDISQYKPYVWEDKNWRIYANNDQIDFEVRSDLEFDGI